MTETPAPDAPVLVAATPTPRQHDDDYSPGLLSGQEPLILMSLSQSSGPSTAGRSLDTARRRRLSFSARFSPSPAPKHDPQRQDDADGHIQIEQPQFQDLPDEEPDNGHNQQFKKQERNDEAGKEKDVACDPPDNGNIQDPQLVAMPSLTGKNQANSPRSPCRIAGREVDGKAPLKARDDNNDKQETYKTRVPKQVKGKAPPRPKSINSDDDSDKESDDGSSISSPPLPPASQLDDDNFPSSPEIEPQPIPRKSGATRQYRVRSKTPTPTKRRTFVVHSNNSTPVKQGTNSKKDNQTESNRKQIHKGLIPCPSNGSDDNINAEENHPEDDNIEIDDHQSKDKAPKRKNLRAYALKTPPATSTLARFVRQRDHDELQALVRDKIGRNRIENRQSTRKDANNGSPERRARDKNQTRRRDVPTRGVQRESSPVNERRNEGGGNDGYESSSTNPPSPVANGDNNRLDGEFRNEALGRENQGSQCQTGYYNVAGRKEYENDADRRDGHLRYRAVCASIPGGGLLSPGGSDEDDEVLVGESPEIVRPRRKLR